MGKKIIKPMRKYLIGIDVGTTAIKTIIFDASTYRIIVTENASHDLSSRMVGWAEESPEDWWQNIIKTIKVCFEKSKINPRDVAGIGVSGMVPAFIQLGAQGEILRPSIQQNDARTFHEIEVMEREIGAEHFFGITGCTLNQQMIGPKILWMKRNEPEIFARTKKMMGSYDYVVYKLTGNFSLERNWALESGLYDVHSEYWSEELLRYVGIDRSFLPPIHKPSDVVGSVSAKAAVETGLCLGTPVVAGTADHVSSAFMAGIQNDGDLLIKLGGAGDILYSTNTLITDHRLFIDYHVIPGKFLLNGCMASSGSILKWYVKDVLGKEITDYAALDQEAEHIPTGSDGIVLLPYFIGEKTPIFDPLARGVIFGLTLHHNKYHIYRAIMEAVGYGFLHHIVTLREIGFQPQRVVVTNGGAISRTWGRIISNITGYSLHYLKENPGSSLGAAFIAGMGCGCFNDWAEAQDLIQIIDIVYPDSVEHTRYQKLYKIYGDLYTDLKDDFIHLYDAIAQ